MKNFTMQVLFVEGFPSNYYFFDVNSFFCRYCIDWNTIFLTEYLVCGMLFFWSCEFIALFYFFVTEPTNHSLGLITAMEMIANWSSSLSSSNKSVLLMYVTCGKLNKHSQIHTILQHMAVMLDIIPTKVLLSAFGLGISRGWYLIFLLFYFTVTVCFDMKLHKWIFLELMLYSLDLRMNVIVYWD